MKSVFVTTSWDDGHRLDARLAALLKKYGIKGTFYIAPKDYESGQEDRLTTDEIKTLSESFEIGAHTMTHAHLTKIPKDKARSEIEESKRYLEELTGRSISAFCYPRGEYRAKHVKMVRDAGFKYARTVRRFSLGPEDVPLEAGTTVNTYNHYSDILSIARFANFNPLKTIKYLQWDVLAKAMFDEVEKTGGQFHLWGHSWELEEHRDWEKLESVLAHIANKKDVQYITNSEIVTRVPKKLLITTPYFPPYNIGGTQLYSYHIAQCLQNDHNWEICVVTSGNHGFRAMRENYDGLTVYRLPYWFKLSNTPMNLWWPVTLAGIMKKERISAVNVHTPVPGLGDMAALVCGKKPIIVTYHAGSMRKGKFLPDIFVWLYEHGPLHILLKRADRITCSSDFVRLKFLADYAYKSTTINPAADADTFKPDVRKRAAYPSILFVAGLSYGEQYKGLKLLINAVRELEKTIKDVRLVVVGDGDMKHVYEAKVKNAHLEKNIIFKGRLTGEKLVEAYQEANLFVLPSSNESFSMAILEAMACALPVVSTNIGGIPSLVDEGNTGFLISPGDLKALVEKLGTLIRDRELASHFGQNARKKIIEKFSWQKQADQYDKILRSTMVRRPTIVTITPYYPPHIGGIEVVAEESSRELGRKGYMVHVYTSDIEAKDSPRKEYSENYEVERLYSFEFAHTPFIVWLPFKLLVTPKNSLFHIHIAQAFISEIAIVVAKIRNFPTVIHFHMEVGPSGPLGFFFVIYKKLFRGLVLRAADKVIVLFPEQIDFLHEQYKVDKTRIVVLPNGVGESYFHRTPRALPEKEFKLLSVGRLALQKRPERLIEMMKHISIPCHLTMVGDGEDRSKLEALTKESGLDNISFLGRKSGDELIACYRDADAFLISSDKEGMPLVVLEAMAARLPVIGTDVDGNRELIKGIGILVSEPYPEKFAEVVTELWKDPEKLRAMSNRSIEKVEQYSWKKLIERLDSIYREVER